MFHEEDQNILPPEIISEILHRVPVKPLIKLQLVCKNWQSIIYSHHFAKTYGDTSGQIGYFSVCLSKKLKFSSRQPLKINLGADCYGLILVLTKDDTNKFCIWNPTIQKLLELPDPHRDTMSMAISYVPASRSFKLLSVYKDEEDSAPAFEVFTLGHSQAWRRLTFTLPDIIPQIIDGKRSTIKKNVRSTLSTGEEVHCCFQYVGDKGEVIHSELISVNMGTESFSITPIPKDYFGFQNPMSVIDWNGHLGYTAIKDENLHVMVLEKYCNKHRWSETKKMIPLPFIRKEKYSSNSLIPLMLTNNGDVWFCLKEEKMFTYNMDTGLVTDKCKMPQPGKYLFPYRPSMTSFQGMEPDTKLQKMRPRFQD